VIYRYVKGHGHFFALDRAYLSLLIRLSMKWKRQQQETSAWIRRNGKRLHQRNRKAVAP